MNKTKIKWCDFTINPICELCKNDFWCCYARKIYKRFKWDTEINYNLSVFSDLRKIKKPSKIFVCSTHDVLSEWIQRHWIRRIISYCSDFPQHTFLFLTKNPARYASFEFLENCYLKISINV